MVDIDAQNPQLSFDPQLKIDLNNNEYSQYLLYSKAEILAVLRSIIQNKIRITAHLDKSQFFFLTAIVAVQPNSNELILEVGGDEKTNAMALDADRVFFTALVDKVKIQFDLKRLRRANDYHGGPVFIGAIPDKLLRLQRREFFRLSTPVGNPIRLCTSLVPYGGNIDIPLLDISGNGVGLKVSVEQADALEKGQTLENCRIVLPNEGLLEVTLRVRNLFAVTNRSGSRYVHVGCEFVNLSASRLSAVQRYILGVERDRKARLNGLA
ncbi:MAG: flagellar brake protein [Candidatus Accumulibacter sp.]|jgi:c-di-GMP-binding flagellar brake protein YcgR|nr:flagellar brake protein [Accumulibacter sp.]